MRARVRENVLVAAAAAMGLLAVGWLSLTDWNWTDYDSEARPALDALVQGHPVLFLKLAPAYGGSLLMRAPFALAPKLWGGGELSMFRAAAVPCMIAVAILGVWLVAQMRARGDSRAARALVLFLCVANPISLPALQYGHPEELLGGALCVFSVIAATRSRPLVSGVLLGLAIANKEWAVLAIGPVLIALPERRWRALVTAGASAALFMLPFSLAAGGIAGQARGAGQTGTMFNPWQLWWFLGSHAHPVRDLGGHIKVGYRVPPPWVSSLSHPLIAAVTVPLSCLYALVRRGPRRLATDTLLLLALLLLLRCALDPWNFSYYPLPFLLVLTAWETLRFARPPVLSLAGSLAAWFSLQELAQPQLHVAPDLQALAFVIFAVPAATAIAVALFVPGLAGRLSLNARRRAVVAAPA